MADEKELNEEEQEMTVTLTLDDDTEVECVVLTVFNAGEHEYIALLALTQRKARFICTVTVRPRTELLTWTTSRMTMSMKSWLKHLTSFWMPRNTMSWLVRTRKNNLDNEDTGEWLREKSRSFSYLLR